MDNLGCKDSASIQIAFGGVPSVSYSTLINDDKKGFIITLNLMNGFSPYSIDNKAIAGSSWSSDTIPCIINQPVNLNYKIKDAFGCLVDFPITETCKCKADAGTLAGTIPFYVCEDQLTSKILVPIDTVLDKNSTWEFILNESCLVKNGKIIQRNKLGQFGFDPLTMVFDKPYYISFILGDSLKGGSGQVKLTDVCLDSTACVTVQFEKNPVVNAGSDDVICGDTYTLKGVSSVTD